MAREELLLAIDQGTSSTKSMLVDRHGSVVASSSVALPQSHPRPGWVEQDPVEIWSSVQRSVRECVSDARAQSVAGVALSVQRETIVLWDRATGVPVAPALSWQDQRTAERASHLEAAGRAEEVFRRTGLPLDPMFSALKASWLLDHHDPDRIKSARGEWRLGTIDAWLLSHFDAEAGIEIGNASRTQLVNIDRGEWDEHLLGLFQIPAASLPPITASTGPFPAVRDLAPLPDGVPLLAVLADSHAALFAHAGWRPGIVKATYGTGTSVMALGPRSSAEGGVCSTIAWQVDDIAMALEANIRATGRTLTWLADVLGIDVETLIGEATTTTDADGITLIPAFGGLGAPWWDRAAAPLLTGFSLGSHRGHLARSALESVAFQVDDAVSAFQAAAGPLHELNCDGGLTRAAALMQFQADVSRLPVRIAHTANLSALGAANLAGLHAGWWSRAELEARATHPGSGRHFRPTFGKHERARRRDAWAHEIRRSRGFACQSATVGVERTS